MPGKTTTVDEEDYLEVDPEVPGQKFVCLSFISPENVLPLKEHFMAESFLHDYDVNFKLEMLRGFLHKVTTNQQMMHDRMIQELLAICPEDSHERIEAISRALRPRIDPVFAQMDAEIATKKDELRSLDVKAAWGDYMFANKKRLEEEFFAAQDFHTTVRGVKVRGVYDNKGEADARCKHLRRKDKNFHVFVGSVGYWLPWDPAANEIQDQDYLETELNTLTGQYKQNEIARDEMYEQDKQERIKAARETAARTRSAASAGPAPELAPREVTANGIDGTGDSMTEKDILNMFDRTGDLALERKMYPGDGR